MFTFSKGEGTKLFTRGNVNECKNRDTKRKDLTLIFNWGRSITKEVRSLLLGQRYTPTNVLN